MSDGLVEALHADIRAMAIDFRLKPGERINEVALSKRLEASRTPLREALNRLVAEGFLTFESGKGFFCRKYSVTEVQDLYQLRQAIERFAAERAVELAADAELAELAAFLDRTGDPTGRSLEDLLAFDEHFHETIASFSQNAEIGRTLANVNARIRFFRWVDLGSRRQRTQGEHRAILDAIRARDKGKAVALVDGHIARRRDEIAEAVKECHARLFVEDDFVHPAFKTMDQACA
ncbi:GntR family transcriptional regulator [Mesorhizobium sp. 8]|uniref:GntR family transcriptional regulator n=1 Tax=Mesorhizobium sp. 8 TaxID=2584466 RepID=UPI001AEE32F5|nr:GntR family transcriptional regulator [Mesorhizobium sp. 8]